MEEFVLTYDSRDATLSSRDLERKRRKVRRTKIRIKRKVVILLTNCPSRILEENILTEEEVETLAFVYRQARRRELNYYPISKSIHNRIRRYVHHHRIIGGEESLGEVLNSRRFHPTEQESWTFDDLLTAAREMLAGSNPPIWARNTPPFYYNSDGTVTRTNTIASTTNNIENEML